MEISIASKPLEVICCNYTIASKCPARRCKGCSTFHELVITPCNGQIAPKNDHLLATCVRGLISLKYTIKPHTTRRRVLASIHLIQYGMYVLTRSAIDGSTRSYCLQKV